MLQSIVYYQTEEKSSINGSYNHGLSFEKYRVQQISVHICDRRGGFVEAISSLAEKTASFHSSGLRVFVLVGKQ